MGVRACVRACAVQLKCKMRHPPGDEIYRDGKVSVFEVDGRKAKVRVVSCLPLLSSPLPSAKPTIFD